MQLRQAIQEISGMKYMTGSLNVLSPIGKNYLLDLPFLTKKDEIETVLNDTDAVVGLLKENTRENILNLLYNKIMQLRDISGTIRRLESGIVLNDIEFFEIKHFAILSEYIRETVFNIGLSCIQIPDLKEVIQMLDPENKRIPHFYIYNRYSVLLTDLRERLKHNLQNETATENLQYEAELEEDRIRKELTQKLSVHSLEIKKALTEIARMDVLLAKGIQACEMNLSRPVISLSETAFTGLFHPEIKDFLSKQHKNFQPVDISVSQSPTVITGANMSGKSVTLQSVALAQTMAQFGFYIPAASAIITPVEKIVVSVSEAVSDSGGLSSFASEMLRLNTMIENAHNRLSQLVLIDEPARTTNPKEGNAIVCGIVDFLKQYKVRSLITTHYSMDMNCRKLRVKGFTPHGSKEKITVQNINSYIDYSLEETNETEVPHEAIKIAEIIGVDRELLEHAKNYFKH